LSSGKILLIDDEFSHRFLISRLLEKVGFEVVACDGGEEGLAYLASHRAEIAAVLTDIKMPGLTGFGVIEQIRLRADGATLPVIVVSSSELPEDQARASALGADDYLVKFPAPDRLAASIRAACALRGGRRAN
jgi:CheY-like chemotaxis protein